MRLEKFQLGDIKFKWGYLLSDIKPQLSANGPIIENGNPHSKNSTLKVLLSDIWTIRTNSIEFSSPNTDRLVNTICINISAEGNTVKSVIKSMENFLGPKSTDYDGKNYGSGSVVKNCTWKYNNCQVGVSIFGGIRKEKNEEYIGSIYFTLDDIDLLDSLYTKDLKEAESIMAESVDDTSVLSFRMNQKQQRTWSGESQKYPKRSQLFVSRALNGFHKRAIFKTPEQLQQNTTAFDISIWKSTTNDYYLSNYWETIKLTPHLETAWVNSLPAKGGGYCHISIGSFRVNNEHSQPETRALISKLEELLNTRIVCQNDNDY